MTMLSMCVDDSTGPDARSPPLSTRRRARYVTAMSKPRSRAPSRTALAASLSGSGAAGRVSARDLVALPRRGLAHLHWRVRGTGALLRVPLLGDAASLERQ